MAQQLTLAAVASVLHLISLIAAYPSSFLSTNGSVLDCNTVNFYLATRDDPDGNFKSCVEQKEPLFSGQLSKAKPIIVLVHGWYNNRKTEFTQYVTKCFLNVSDVNVIQVDWSAYAENWNYLVVRNQVEDVGLTVAAFLSKMSEELHVDWSGFHLIGHSLGSHVVGIAGNKFTSPKIGRITGLDPAGPLYWFTGVEGRISKESANFVVILHTCAGLLGKFGPLGHVDFYANGGIPIQPGCSGQDFLGFCSHDRAINIFAESVLNPFGFEGIECSNYIFYLLGLCTSNKVAHLSAKVDRNVSGDYYFKTASSYPFALK